MKPAKALILLLGAALAAGCGTTSSVASHADVAAAQKATASSDPPYLGTRQEMAVNEAGNLLAQFIPPPGAVRLAKKPALPSGGGTMGLVYTKVAQDVRYWRVRGNPTTLLAWEKAHMAHTFSRQDVLIGPPSWNTVYTLPPVPRWFAAREINAQFYDVGGGETVIMADAMVAWVPARAATEVIPASVKVVTIAGNSTTGPEQATITAAPTVLRLARYVNELPVSTVGPAPCPSGSGFTLTFRDSVGGPPVAVANGPGGCGVVNFRLDGKDQPDLMVVTDQASYKSTILNIAGLHWKLP